MFSVNYRPFDFAGMVGQEGILKEMRNRSTTLNFPETTILVGESGSGKTTLAFIIAALLNCTNLQTDSDGTHKPCGECASCRSIRENRFNRDVHFYDCSSLSKEDVHKIHERVNSAPMFDTNKVVILDEAQELTRTGKGATLGLLEKPRKNVYFILCTMNPEKLDKAILGRGQLYKFRGVSSEAIAQHLISVLETEDPDEQLVPSHFIQDEAGNPGGLFTISEFAQGSVRQALQYLERCINGGFFTPEEIKQEFGFFTQADLIRFVYGLLGKDRKVLGELSGVDIEGFFYSASRMLARAAQASIAPSREDKEYTEKFLKTPTFPALLEAFRTLHQRGSFNRDVFMFEMYRYFHGLTTATAPAETPRETNQMPQRQAVSAAPSTTTTPTRAPLQRQPSQQKPPPRRPLQ